MAVRQALLMLWEASDRLCGKRLNGLIPVRVDSMERHGHLYHSRINGKQQQAGHASNPSGKTQAVAAPKARGGDDFLKGAAMQFSNALNHLMAQAQTKYLAFKGGRLPAWR